MTVNSVKHIFMDDITITPTNWAVSVVDDGSNRPFHEFIVIQGMNDEGQSLFYRGFLGSENYNESISISKEKKIIEIVKLENASEKFINKSSEYYSLFYGVLQRTVKIADTKGKEILEIIGKNVRDKIEYVIVEENRLIKISENVGCSTESKTYNCWAHWVLFQADVKIEDALSLGTSVVPPKNDNQKSSCVVL